LFALRKQVPEVLQDLQQLTSPSPFQQTGSNTAAPPLPDPSTLFNSLVKLATDPEAQKEVEDELKNSLRSTPKGLETPKYKVVRKLDGPLFLGKPEVIELRDYPEFTVAKTNMTSFAFGSSSGAEGFNTLASYLFGKNEDDKEMKMTMPVEISSAGNGAGSMAFVLPKSNSAAPPAPLSSSDVSIETVPARLVVAKSFGGIVTDQEVERQKAMLLEALIKDGSVLPVDESHISVLQYNSPLTIPWRRRNEVAIVVKEKTLFDAIAEKVTESIATPSNSTEQASESVATPSNSTELSVEANSTAQSADEPIAESAEDPSEEEPDVSDSEVA
jgi:hypothetical protein